MNLLQLLSPSALGGPADYDGLDNYWESVFSFGLVPLVLVGVACAGSSQRPRVRGWVVLVVLSVWFAGGRQLGLFHVLYRFLPGLCWFRVPARSLFLTSLGMAILAGFGLEVLRGRLVAAGHWRCFAIRLAKTALVVIWPSLAGEAGRALSASRVRQRKARGVSTPAEGATDRPRLVEPSAPQTIRGPPARRPRRRPDR